MNEDYFDRPPTPDLVRNDLEINWVLGLSSIATAGGVYSMTKEYGSFQTFVASDWIALIIDVMTTAVIWSLLLAVLPNAIRRRRIRKGIRESKPQVLVPVSKFLGFMVVVACVAAVLGVLNSDPVSSASSSKDSLIVGSREKRCEMRGADELCVEVVYLGNERASTEMSWTYAVDKLIFGQTISRLVWKAVIDCQLQTGEIEYLFAYDRQAMRVDIDEMARNQMLEGIQLQQLDPLVAKQCAQP